MPGPNDITHRGSGPDLGIEPALDGLVLRLEDAVASGTSAGTLTQNGNQIEIEIDGTGVTTPTAPACYASWPVRDPLGAIITTLGALTASMLVLSTGPASSDMEFGLILANDPDPASATVWSCCSILFNGAVDDPDLSQETQDDAGTPSTAGAADAVKVTLSPWIGPDTGVVGACNLRRVEAWGVKANTLGGYVIAKSLNDRVDQAYLILVAYNRTGGGGGTDGATVACAQSAVWQV